MELTLLGGVLLPLCALFCLSPGSLLMLVQASTVFGAGAALLLGGSGIQPALVPGGLFIACMALQALLGAEMPGARPALRLLAPMIALGIYAVVTAFVMPRLFDGALEVWPQKPEPPADVPVVLHPGAANLTQSAYLAIDLGLLCLAAVFLSPRPAALRGLLTAFLLGGYAVVGLCFWQLANRLAGLPFPEDFLYSNPGWSILSHQGLGGVPRISGPFTEPSSLAFYLCGTVYTCAWLLIRGHRHRLAAPLLPLALLCLLLSTSTTGFAVLALGVAICGAYCLRTAPDVAARVLRVALPAGAAALLAGAAVVVLLPGVAASAAVVVQHTLAKGDSSSFEERGMEDRDSLALIVPTAGLGVGWGSNRSSSLLPGLLAGLGVAGLAFPVWFVLRLLRALREVRSAPAGLAGSRMAIDAFAAGTLGSLLTAIVSAPMIVSAGFYLNLAGLVAGIVQVGLAHRRAVALAVLLAGLSLTSVQAAEPLTSVQAAEPLTSMQAAEPLTSVQTAEPIAGVATHFAQLTEPPAAALALLRRGGFASVRDEMYWSVVETAAGEITIPPRWAAMVADAHGQGLNPLLVLDYGNPLYDGGDKPRSPAAIAAFARYSGAIAARLRGQAGLYEIWNEWNGGLGHTTRGTMADYLPLLQQASAAVKAADPDAKVLADGILWSDGRPGVIEQAIRLGALHAADGIALHPYFFDRGTDHHPEAWAAYLRAAETRMRAANGGAAVSLFITELGWPSSTGPGGISAGLQAAYAARVYLLSRTMDFVAGLWWYDLRDDRQDPADVQANFGLLHHDLSAKPAFSEVAGWLGRLAGAQFLGQLAALPANVAGLAFRGRNGGFRAVWSTDDAPRTLRLSGREVLVGANPVLIDGVDE